MQMLHSLVNHWTFKSNLAAELMAPSFGGGQVTVAEVDWHMSHVATVTSVPNLVLPEQFADGELHHHLGGRK